ncbi:MAG TPA: protein kinase [Verrucomicrobiae bacterium]
MSKRTPHSYVPHTLKLDLHRRARLPVDECLTIGLALTAAVQHLHEHGLVHRDIKPSNIIWVGGVPKLADIGLVASMDRTMSFVGTSGFLPPEGPGTPQADLYSLGKVLYEISTGRDRTDFPKLPPELLEATARTISADPSKSDCTFALTPALSPRRGSSPSAMSGEYEKSPPQDRSTAPLADGDSPSPGGEGRGEGERSSLLELNAVILKACHHDPRQRYQSAPEMAADLALLQRGQSVKRKQRVEKRVAIVQRLFVPTMLLALLVAGGGHWIPPSLKLIFRWRKSCSNWMGIGPGRKRSSSAPLSWNPPAPGPTPGTAGCFPRSVASTTRMPS